MYKFIPDVYGNLLNVNHLITVYTLRSTEGLYSLWAKDVIGNKYNLSLNFETEQEAMNYFNVLLNK